MDPAKNRLGSALRLASVLLGFATTLFLARILGAEAFGEYSYWMAWILLGASIVQAGLPSLLIREVATPRFHESPHEATSLYGFGLVTGVGGASLIAGSLALLGAVGLLGGSSSSLLYVGLPGVIFSAWTSVSEAMTRGTGDVIRGQLEQIVRPSLQIVCVAALATSLVPKNAFWATAAFSLSCLVAAVVADRVRARRIPLFDVLGSFAQHVQKLRGLLLLSGIGWLGAFSLQAGTILLGLLSTEVEVAQYRVAVQVGTAGSIGVTVAYATHLPELNAALIAGDQQRAETLARASSRFCLALGLVTIAPLLLGGEKLFEWLLGPEYRGVWLCAMILLGGQLVHAATGVVAGILYGAHAELLVLGLLAVFFSLRVLASIALIPRWGKEGAALAAALEVALFHGFLVMAAKRRAGVWSLPLKL